MKRQPNAESAKAHAYALRDLQDVIAPIEDHLLAQLPSKDEIIQRAKKRRLHQHMRHLMVAAIFLSGILLYAINPVYQTEHLQTALGQTQGVELKDGSRIHLNSATRMQVQYRLRSKNIELYQGEASFEVEHYAHTWLRPFERAFMVRSGSLLVEDIGTVFNVRHFDAQHSQVTVLQGKVRVSIVDQPQQAALELEQQQAVEQVGQRLSLYQVKDLDQVTAWQQGYLQFKALPLAQVIASFQRYQKVDVQLHDALSREFKISGRFQFDQAEQFMQILPQISPLQVRQDPQSGQWQIAAITYD
ncbi:FecR family protein [Acinetobacter larvae]|uniref:FecR protein domain-containing protein n=1 Tax=Acinetobacter larvae TaxID=1789224 RepID=A0A1B2LY99_9GAMM|nr:FecR domain-containing protein [Acinetobacter larvae]AOA57753.1 hypothetical protein BFG52_04865 [Acinetobacter larvae]